MITVPQIRAARGLLGWDAGDLAEKTGLTRATLSNIENDNVQARGDTLERIYRVFTDNRIEFQDNDGVRFRPEGLEVLNGEDGIKKFLDHVYSCAQNLGGVIRQNGIEDETFFKYANAATIEHCAKMAALRSARKNVLVRVLAPVGIMDFKCPDYAEYKWFPRNSPMPVPYYIYGDTVGIFAVDKDTSPRIYQITSPIITATYTQQFDSAWEMATDPVSAEKTSKKK